MELRISLPGKANNQVVLFKQFRIFTKIFRAKQNCETQTADFYNYLYLAKLFFFKSLVPKWI